MLEKSQLFNSTPVAVFLLRVILSDFLLFFPPFPSSDTFVNLKKKKKKKKPRKELTFLLGYISSALWLGMIDCQED